MNIKNKVKLIGLIFLIVSCNKKSDFTIHENISENYAYFNDIAVDKHNKIYFSFKDFAHYNRLSVMTYKENVWQYVDSPAITKLDIYYNTMEISNENIPYIAYLDWEYQGKLTVIRYFKKKWEVVGFNGISDGLVENISMTIDDLGRIYVAYSDRFHDYKMCLKVFDDNKWSDVITPGDIGGSFQALSDSIKLLNDENGVLYLLFIDSNDGNNLKLSKIFNNKVETISISDKTSEYIDMILSNDSIYTVHSENNMNVFTEIKNLSITKKIIYNKRKPAFYNKLTLGKNDIPVIAMIDSKSLKLNLKKYADGKIKSIKMQKNAKGMVSYINITNDINKNIYIAYRDHENDNKAGLIILKSDFIKKTN